MNKFKLWWLVLLIILTTPAFSQDYWIQIPVADTFGINSVSFGKDGNLYLSGNGVYRSEDNGENWECVGLNGKCVFCVAVDSTGTIFAGVGPGGSGVYRFLNGQWERVLFSINFMSVCIDSNSNIFAGNWGGIFKSADYGESWTQVLISDIGCHEFNVIFEKEREMLFSGSRHFVLPDSGGVHRSLNGGDDWELTGLTGGDITSFARESKGYILASDGYEGIFRSTLIFYKENPPITEQITICCSPFCIP